MAAKPITVRFINRREIRMGSPYMHCRARLSGKWVPQLPNDGEDFQDIKAWSPDGKYLALVEWNTKANTPGFHIHVISVRNRSIKRSRRIRGCCESVKWQEDHFAYTAFAFNSGSIKV